METEKKTTTNAKATKKENVEVKVESKPKTTAKKTETKTNSTPAAKKSASAPKTEKTAVVKENKTAEVKAAPKKEEVIKPAPKKTEHKVKAVAEEPKKKKILFLAGESAPFIRTGGLGDVAGALPATLNALGADARVILPLYMEIPQDFKNASRQIFLQLLAIPVTARLMGCGSGIPGNTDLTS